MEGLAMLVLSRKRGEKIIIGDQIVVTVLEIQGNKVRLGIEAPDEVEIHRYEVWVEIQEENTASGDDEEEPQA